MDSERLEGRVTMYLVMAIYIHMTHAIWYGTFSMLVIVGAVLAAAYLTPDQLQRVGR